MPTEKDGISAALGMIFLVLGLSVVVPGVILNLENPQTNTFQQDESERTVITGDVSSTITEITNQDEVNISILDRKSGEFNSTGQLMPGDNATVAIAGQNITVTLVDVFDTQEAAVTYTYPLYIGWPDGSSEIVKSSPQIILLAGIVMLIGLLFTIHGVFFP